MNSKFYILISFLVFLQLNVFSQKKDNGFLKAQELYESRNYYEALYEFKTVNAHDEFEKNFKNEYLALCYLHIGNYVQALSYLNSITSTKKNYLLGKAYLESNKLDSAIFYLNKSLKNNENLETYELLGKSFFLQKDYENALLNMEKAENLGSNKVFVKKILGISYFFKKTYLKTIVNLEIVQKHFPYDKEVNNYLGMSYFNVARKDLAIETLRNGIDINDYKTAEAAVNLSLVFDDLEMPDSSIYYLKKAIKINPKRVDIYYFLGNKYYDLKKYNQSRHYYEMLLEINPTYDKAYKQLANSYFLDKKYDKAIEKYIQSTFFKDKPAEELNYIGICYLQSNNITKAKQYFEEAIKKDNTFYVSYINLANISFHNKKFDEAISFLTYANKYSKNNADIYYLYAKIYLQLEKLEDSEHYFKETIRFNSLKKQAYLYLGHLSLIKNEVQKANFYYDILLTFEPNNFQANMYRGIASFLSEEYQNSITYLIKAEKLNPQDYKTKYQLAKVFIKIKDYNTAYKKLIELKKLKPSDKRIYYMLLKTVKALKKKEKVKKYKLIIKSFEKGN